MTSFHSQLDPWIFRRNMVLNTDLYEITMLSGYWAEGIAGKLASFDYFFRELPPDTGFGVFAGLESIIDFARNLRFESDDIEYLRSLNLFPEGFLAWLSEWRFECDIWSAPEGALVFANEPVLRVEGPLGQSQLLETFILNSLNYSTLIATKAARICLAAQGDPVIEFGLRRAQGPDGGLSGSRAAYIGGCTGTSNCLAGKTFGIPVKGTIAHSWIMSFPTELEAFRQYARNYPHNCILLVDTYGTIESGVPNAITVFRELR
jgi:nicotinate phosphoribosyltransferase